MMANVQKCMTTLSTFCPNTESHGLAMLPLKAIILGSAVDPCCKCARNSYRHSTQQSKKKMYLLWCSYIKPVNGRVYKDFFLSAISSVLLPLQVSLMAKVHHTAIKEEKWTIGITAMTSILKALQEKEPDHDLFNSPWLWRSLSPRILDVVSEAWPYHYVSPLQKVFCGTFRKCWLLRTSMAIKCTAVSILLFALASHSMSNHHPGQRQKQWHDIHKTEHWNQHWLLEK